MKVRVIEKLMMARKILFGCAGVVAAGVLVMIGFMHAPAAKAQASTTVPNWEAVSIRRCDAPLPNAGRGGPVVSEGRYTLRCGKVEDVIYEGYILYADGKKMNLHNVYETLTGGPGWIRSDSYDIEAKPEGMASREMMSGPMVQALLEDRFKLKIHREVKEVPVYNLVITKGGPKMPKVDEASCPAKLTPQEVSALAQAGRQRPTPCGNQTWSKKPPGPSMMSENDHGISMKDFARGLTGVMDRPVIDKTGLSGLFDFHVEFSPDESTPAFIRGGAGGRLADIPSDPGGPSYFTAIQEQLGLRLEPTKGPSDSWVIDSIERPSEN